MTLDSVSKSETAGGEAWVAAKPIKISVWMGVIWHKESPVSERRGGELETFLKEVLQNQKQQGERIGSSRK